MSRHAYDPHNADQIRVPYFPTGPTGRHRTVEAVNGVDFTPELSSVIRENRTRKARRIEAALTASRAAAVLSGTPGLEWNLEWQI